jgi:ABC-type Fe3+-siderophore transport system permease subunit
MSLNGVNSVDILDINDGDSFLFVLGFSILPTMNPFPAPKSVLVVDNAAVHNRVQMYLLCARFGVILLFLSVYSFDFNPMIELLFGIAKRNMESLGCNTDNRLLPEHLRYHLWNAITSAEACSMFEHCFW